MVRGTRPKDLDDTNCLVEWCSELGCDHLWSLSVSFSVAICLMSLANAVGVTGKAVYRFELPFFEPVQSDVSTYFPSFTLTIEIMLM